MRISRIRDERSGVEDDVLPVGIFPAVSQVCSGPRTAAWVVRRMARHHTVQSGKMAEILVDLMTEKLIDVKDTFAKLDSHEFADVLKQPLRVKVREQFEEVMTENAPDLWLTPPGIREE